MYVTSDIFDLERNAALRRKPWVEKLVCGVSVYGSIWPGPERAARYLLEAAKVTETLPQMLHGGFNLVGQSRTRAIRPKSVEAISEGKLRGAAEAVAVLLTGPGESVGEIWCVGGEVSASSRCDFHPTKRVSRQEG